MDDILNRLPKKRLLELRDSRVSRLEEERKSLEEQHKEQERDSIRDRILQK